jgi:hypothetical protein
MFAPDGEVAVCWAGAPVLALAGLAAELVLVVVVVLVVVFVFALAFALALLLALLFVASLLQASKSWLARAIAKIALTAFMS